MIYRIRVKIAWAIKKIFGIDNLTLFLQKKKHTIEKLYYRKKYGANNIIEHMQLLGMKKGSTVFIHCAMNQFYNYTGSVEDLIEGIISYIGNEGTLLMPAYPKQIINPNRDINDPNWIDFDVLNTPTGAGYMAEVFRKMPNVKRSINLQHSVCALGKDADYFVNEHHLSETAWDKYSPYYKLCYKNGLIFSFGLSGFIGTIIHCPESLLKDKYEYFNQFFTNRITYRYIDSNKRIGMHTMLMPNLIRKMDKRKMIKKYLSKSQYDTCLLSNLRISMSNAKEVLEIYMKLAHEGITMYSIPNPTKFKDENGLFIKVDKVINELNN